MEFLFTVDMADVLATDYALWCLEPEPDWMDCLSRTEIVVTAGSREQAIALLEGALPPSAVCLGPSPGERFDFRVEYRLGDRSLVDGNRFQTAAEARAYATRVGGQCRVFPVGRGVAVYG